MLALVQRVKSGSVKLSKHKEKIESGLVIFVCLEDTDTESTFLKFGHKMEKYCFFNDEQGRFSRCINDISGEVLLISQFSLLASTNKGLKPSFHKAANYQDAKKLFKSLKEILCSRYNFYKFGEFGANMTVEIINDGPLTLTFKFK